jgi:hypothetical protein
VLFDSSLTHLYPFQPLLNTLSGDSMTTDPSKESSFSLISAVLDFKSIMIDLKSVVSEGLDIFCF